MVNVFDPSEILGKQGWERAKRMEDYFAGWETSDEDDDEPYFTDLVAKVVG